MGLNGMDEQQQNVIDGLLQQVKELASGGLMKFKLIEFSLPVIYYEDEEESSNMNFEVTQVHFFLVADDRIHIHDSKPYACFEKNGEMFNIEMPFEMLRKKYKALYA